LSVKGSLIELLVVVAIIGILAAVGVVAYNGYTASASVSIISGEITCELGQSLIIDNSEL
jgi:prepilin-type N-terminal cleavage/methylation domain-containing protein